MTQNHDVSLVFIELGAVVVGLAVLARIASRFGNDLDFIASSREFFGENFRDRFNPTDARMEEIRGKKNLHSAEPARSEDAKYRI